LLARCRRPALPAVRPTPTPRLTRIEEARRAVMLHGGATGTAAIEPWIAASWQRCLVRGQRPQDSVGFDLVTAAALRRVNERNRSLREAAAPVLADLSRTIAPTRYFSILTDAQGVVVDVGGAPDMRQRAVQAIARIGVDLSERSVGTTAISAALTELHPVWLHRGEHFFEATSVYSCAGAPIFGPDGHCAGMLDLTGVHAEERPELRHLAAQMAQRVEQALLFALPHERLLQVQWPGPASAAGAGLLAVDGDGAIVGADRAAGAMLGLHAGPTAHGWGTLADVFATPGGRLMGLRPGQAPRRVPLWSGLQVLIAAARSGRDGCIEPLRATPARLRDTETDLIRRAVDAARGNVAEAARQLGISRATIYRRLARTRQR
jgi:sigma-54 dependent transcriptional regulator, acetoin dehydrogenase operon transcriptional activator AcoR